jgi:hypothetical protein
VDPPHKKRDLSGEVVDVDLLYLLSNRCKNHGGRGRYQAQMKVNNGGK